MEKILAEKRINISFYKRKNGALVTTLYLPPKWLEVIGVTENERQCFFYIEDKAIKISKEKQSEEAKEKTISFSKTSTKTYLNNQWVGYLGVTEEDRSCIIELRKEYIILIKDDGRNVLKL
ncbi:hypothetical protein [Clostridium perfringens]|uniref:hypothetical protein n=1 Tax=Clostridium perfringens TaxID=1502 RepID=UPI001039F251|nr:hypothetical protein [Clostridium perfringens]TBX05625.1 hypothetical protein BFS03_13485 [Clostridium perfringens]